MGQAARHQNLGRSIMFGPYVYAGYEKHPFAGWSGVLRFTRSLRSFKSINRPALGPHNTCVFAGDFYSVSLDTFISSDIIVRKNNLTNFVLIPRPPRRNFHHYRLAANANYLAVLAIHTDAEMDARLYLVDWLNTSNIIEISIALPNSRDDNYVYFGTFSIASDNRILITGWFVDAHPANKQWHHCFNIDTGVQTATYLWDRVDIGSSVRPGSQIFDAFCLLQFPRPAHANEDGGRVAVCNRDTGVVINNYDIATDVLPVGGVMLSAATMDNNLYLAVGGETTTQRIYSIIRYLVNGSALTYEYAAQSVTSLANENHLLTAVWVDQK